MRASRETSTGWRQLLDWLAVLLLSVGGFELTARLARYSEPSPIVAYLVGFCCVVISTLTVALWVPRDRNAGIGAALLACAWLCIAVLAPAAERHHYAAVCVLMGLLTVGTGLGALIGRRIEKPSHLLFVALVSGVADTLSVVQPGGISKAISEAPVALALLALPWPMLGTRDVVPFLGVSDVLFASLYLHAARTHGLPIGRTLLALGAGFATAALLVVSLQRTIPVLPLLGVGILLAHPRARSATPEDLRRGAWVLAALAGVIASVFLRRSP